ncbi:hypothetical protein [Peromfec virus RodF5_8]|uniref:Uncharacterized protein n=1 Tax=Peromfec virus RodF5_8 TaxID=2929344 RepID=A0A976N2H3_9VIRU|nr:hypothetical protein [Peromfec virus RodF5_8]
MQTINIGDPIPYAAVGVSVDAMATPVIIGQTEYNIGQAIERPIMDYDVPYSSTISVSVTEALDFTDDDLTLLDRTVRLVSPSTRLRWLELRARRSNQTFFEHPSFAAEIDETTRTTVRDLLFCYTGQVDANLYRNVAPSMYEVDQTLDNPLSKIREKDLDPDSDFAIVETFSNSDEKLEAFDVIRQEHEKRNVFRRQESIRRSQNRDTASQSGADAVSTPPSGSDSSGATTA